MYNKLTDNIIKIFILCNAQIYIENYFVDIVYVK